MHALRKEKGRKLVESPWEKRKFRLNIDKLLTKEKFEAHRELFCFQLTSWEECVCSYFIFKDSYK